MNTNRTRRILSLGASVVMCIASQTLAAPHWGLQSTSGPSPRVNHGMAYDSFRGVVVLYGGHAGSNKFRDTWEWNGQTWSLRAATSGADPFAGQGMAYDSNRRVTVLFGGYGELSNVNDTWEWDGNTWTQKLPSSRPSARHGPGMAFDSLRNVVVMFGGYQPGLTNDTWKWDGTNWTQVTTTTPPSARSWVGMAYDSARDRIVVYGGNLNPICSGPNTDQTWELDMSMSPATWTQITTTNKPPARHRGKLVYDSTRGKMLLFGGSVGCGLNAGDTWEYNGQAPSWTLVSKPGAPEDRDGHDMVYDGARQEVLMFGGGLGDIFSGGTSLGDTWSFGERAAAIPTLSEWGMMAMAGLVVLAGAVVIGRRKKALG